MGKLRISVRYCVNPASSDSIGTVAVLPIAHLLFSTDQFASHQHDGSDCHSEHAQHQIVRVIHRFNLAVLFEPHGIRSTTEASDGDWDVSRTVGPHMA